MNNIMHLFKGIIAIGFVVLLVMFGVSIFVFLLGLACVAAIVFWFRKQFSPSVPAYREAGTGKKYAAEFSETMARDDYTSTTIIEGVAEDVTAENASKGSAR